MIIWEGLKCNTYTHTCAHTHTHTHTPPTESIFPINTRGQQGPIIARSAKELPDLSCCCQLVSSSTTHTEITGQKFYQWCQLLCQLSQPYLCFILPLHTHTHIIIWCSDVRERGKRLIKFCVFWMKQPEVQNFEFSNSSDGLRPVCVCWSSHYKITSSDCMSICLHAWGPPLLYMCVCVCVCMSVRVSVWVGGMRQHTVPLSWQSRNSINNWWKMFCGHFSDSLLVERKWGERRGERRGEMGRRRGSQKNNE